MIHTNSFLVIPFQRVRIAFFFTVIALIQISRTHAETVQNTAQLNVTDGRPVAAAVQELVSRYGYVITYEDPRPVYERDLEDVTTQVRKDLYKYPAGNAPKVMVPVDASLSLNVPPSDTVSVETMASILEQLMQAQSRTGGGGHFRVERVGDIFHVLPTAVRDRDGSWVAQTSIFDVPISLPMGDRSADGMINAICDAVSAAAHFKVNLAFKVGGLSDPSRPRPYRLGADKEKARDVLMRALNLLDTSQKRTWVLFYDPSENQRIYFLTIEGVPNRSSSSVAAVAPKAKTLPTSSPGATKSPLSVPSSPP